MTKAGETSTVPPGREVGNWRAVGQSMPGGVGKKSRKKEGVGESEPSNHFYRKGYT